MDRVAACGAVDPSSTLGRRTNGGVPEWPNGMVSKTISVYRYASSNLAPTAYIILLLVGSHSGLVRTIGNRVWPQGYRGFESLPHRQSASCINPSSFHIMSAWSVTKM